MVFKNMIFISAIMAFASCGVQIQKTRDLDIQYVDSSVGEPRILTSENIKSDCFASQAITTRNYSHFNFNYYSFKADTSLFSNITFGGSKEIFESSIGRRSRFPKNIYGVKFSACGGYDYSKNQSFEAAAASALYSFKNLELNKELLPLGIGKLRLRVATNVTSVKEFSQRGSVIRDSKKLINNAFYSNRYNEIVFLPQGKPKRGSTPYSNIPMWEIPFVGAHEYGHHIFAYLVPNYIKDTSFHHTEKLCFESLGVKHTEHAVKNENSQRVVNFRSIMVSLNEGFSDLFARVVVDKEIDLKGITCLSKTREVSDNMFANRSLKKLTDHALTNFLSPHKNPRGNCLKRVNYQDPHMIGAIIAHMFYKRFEKIDLPKKSKMKILYEYLKEVNLKYYALKSLPLRDSMQEIVLIGLKLADRYQPMNKREHCRFVATYYPALSSFYSCK